MKLTDIEQQVVDYLVKKETMSECGAREYVERNRNIITACVFENYSIEKIVKALYDKTG